MEQPLHGELRKILKSQLDYCSWGVDSEVKRTTGRTTFAKSQAAAQMGIRLKDDLRTAKDKIDAIASSL